MKIWSILLYIHVVAATPISWFDSWINTWFQPSTSSTSVLPKDPLTLTFMAQSFPWIMLEYIHPELGLSDRMQLSRTSKLFYQLEPIHSTNMWEGVYQVTQFMRSRVDSELWTTHVTQQQDESCLLDQKGIVQVAPYAYIHLKSTLNKPPFVCLSSHHDTLIFEFMAYKGWNRAFIDRIHHHYPAWNQIPNDQWDKWHMMAAKFNNQELYTLTLDRVVPSLSTMDAGFSGSNFTFIEYNFLKNAKFDSIPTFSTVFQAASSGRSKWIEYLFQHYPHLIHPTCVKAALMAALRGGHVSVVQYISQYYDISDNASIVIQVAITSTHVDLIQYLVQQHHVSLTTDACLSSLVTGRFDIIMYTCQGPHSYFHQHKVPRRTQRLLYNEKTLVDAAPFLYDERVLDYLMVDMKIRPTRRTLNTAFFHGNHVLFKYLIEKGWVSPDRSMLNSAYTFCASPTPLNCDVDVVIDHRFKMMNYLCRYLS